MSAQGTPIVSESMGRQVGRNPVDAASGVPRRKRGLFGNVMGYGKRFVDNGGLRVLGGALMDADGTLGTGNMQRARQDVERQQAQRQAQEAAEAEQARIRALMQTLPEDLRTVGAVDPQAAVKEHMERSRPQARKIVKGVDGRSYYEDTKEPVLPGVQAPEQTMTPYQQEQVRLREEELALKRERAGNGSGLEIYGPNGEVIRYGGNNLFGGSRADISSDASQIEDMRKRAADLIPLQNTLYAARAELLGADGEPGTEDDLQTGAWATTEHALRKFVPGTSERQTRLDNFEALEKEYGIEKLSGIGGNDTERELLTAIQTGPNREAQTGSNLSRLNRAISTVEFIGNSRAAFAEQWRRDHGSLSLPAQSGAYAGKTYSEALTDYQRSEALRTGLLGAAPSGSVTPEVADQNADMEDLLQYMTPEERALFEGQQ